MITMLCVVEKKKKNRGTSEDGRYAEPLIPIKISASNKIETETKMVVFCNFILT